MLFKRKGSLKKEYDSKLLSQMEELKKQWHDEKRIYEKSIDISDDLDKQVKLAEIKFFYLFKEVKERKIKIGKVN